MASADTERICGLNYQMRCQDRLCVSSDADKTKDKTLAYRDSRSE